MKSRSALIQITRKNKQTSYLKSRTGVLTCGFQDQMNAISGQIKISKNYLNDSYSQNRTSMPTEMWHPNRGGKDGGIADPNLVNFGIKSKFIRMNK